MRHHLWLGTLVVAACTNGPMVEAPRPAPEIESHLRSTAPTPDTPGCWQQHTRPALLESVSEQVVVKPETRDAAGEVITPAVLRTETRQSEVRPRQTVWFRKVCPEQDPGSPAFVASLQRALKARGLYTGAVTGRMTPATEAAVRTYQTPSGLNSTVLSLQAAQALGLIMVRD